MKRITLLIILFLIVYCSDKSPSSHIFAAKQHIEQQQVQAAIIELKNAVKLDTNSAEARFLLGKTYLDSKQYLAAEKELSRALDLDYPVSIMVPLLSLAFQKTQADVALLELSYKNEAIPSSKNMRLVYATFLSNDNTEAGYNFIKEHVELKPNDLAAIMILANAQISLDTSAAIDNYKKALSLNPKNVVALNNLAYFYL